MSNVVPQLHPAISRYLEELELQLKRIPLAAPEEGLADAREFLLAEWDTLQRQSTNMESEALFQHFVERFGSPADVAAGYAPNIELPDRRLGNAPGWRLCCTKCGRSAPAAQAGIVRIGARSRHKYILGYCRGCHWLRCMRLIQDLDQTNLTAALDSNVTPEELRREMHQPLRTVALILVLTACIIAAVWGVIGALIWWLR